MKQTIFKDLLFSTVMLAVLWFGFSTATTVYIAWLDQGYKKVINENVASMRATGEIQGLLWKLHDALTASLEGNMPEIAQRTIDTHLTRFQIVIQDIKPSINASEDANNGVAAKIRELALQYVSLLTEQSPKSPTNAQHRDALRNRSRNLAVQISAHCNHLREAQQSLIDKSIDRREAVGTFIGGSRIVLLFLGPLLGIWLGYRTASRIRFRLSEISARLGGISSEAGQLPIVTPISDLEDLDKQVGVITKEIEQSGNELRSARQEVLRSERLASVGQLAAGIAHELRNPMTGVKLLTQAVARKYSQDEQTSKLLGVICEEVTRMERTIQGLLDFARPPAQQRTQHDLRETIARAINLVEGRATKDEIQIVQQIPNEPFHVDADREQLHQVFVNLLLNGMDAMSNGGRLTISLRYESTGSSSHLDQRWCVTTVADTGCGIEDEVMERLFEPFVTTKERGTGLGLAISRRIIEHHGGMLTAANSLKGGAEFSVRLPVISTSHSNHRLPEPKASDVTIRSEYV